MTIQTYCISTKLAYLWREQGIHFNVISDQGKSLVIHIPAGDKPPTYKLNRHDRKGDQLPLEF